MDWFAVYGKIIEYRRQNVLVYIKGKTPGIERHHIVPLSQNGSDDETNIICLTSREHFIVHKILHKMYPRNVYLLNAAYKMAKLKDSGKHTCRLYRVSSMDIEQLRKDLNYFLRHSKWINNGSGKRHRVWKDDPVPEGWLVGMGEPSQKFKDAMNRRAKQQYPVKVDGKVYSPKDIEEKYGIPRSQVVKRIKAGWLAEKIVSIPYVKPDRLFTPGDEAELRRLFEEWKTVRTVDLISKYPDIFNGRHGKITNIRLVTLFKNRIPEYSEFINKPGHIHSVFKITYNGKTQSIVEWAKEVGISHNVLSVRLKLGWPIADVLTRPVIKAGQNFADSKAARDEKEKRAKEMFAVFVEAGCGFKGVDAVNEKFGTSICYDSIRRMFRRFGLDPKKPLIVFEYNGQRMTIPELAAETGLPEATVYNRLVRNPRTDLTIKQALAENLPRKDNSKRREKDRYVEFKPLFDLYVASGGGTAGYEAVVRKFGYRKGESRLRQTFRLYVPEYREFQRQKKAGIRKVMYEGKLMTIAEFADYIGMKVNVVRSRLEDGWTLDRIAECPFDPRKDSDFRKNEVRPLFEYWLENGFSGLNEKFGTHYKDEGCVTSLFRKYFKDEYEYEIRSRSVMFTDVTGGTYTFRELNGITGLSRAVLAARISAGCGTVQEITEYGENRKNALVELLKKYLSSYSNGGMRMVMRDFPDCKYSGSSLRAMFLRYIPDLYKPSAESQKTLRIKSGEQVVIDGMPKTIGEWAREYNIPVWKIRQRLNDGISGKDLLKKENLHANIIEYDGKTYEGYAQLAREFGIDRSTLLNRIKRGMTLAEALAKPVRQNKS